MNKWQQRLEEAQKDLASSKEWIDENFLSLPDSVRSIIISGLGATERSIETYKELAAKAEEQEGENI
ncbi:hypothetical protein [Parafrankia elaeagni]|uniref:hypothetical protein n=1 Tax=Parafrankia elaeagni TaxID=222534 RepID=UPI0012B5B312|nr:hypothetical protein [Parafrankia elaeagni]